MNKDLSYKVLIVCTGNICRSPMAEGLLKNYLPKHLTYRVEVTSAGTSALHGHQAHRHAISAMAHSGIDIRHHRARQITRQIARSADLILVMEAAHISQVKNYLGWGANKPRRISEFDSASPTQDIQDPYGKPYKAYERCIRDLRPCIRGITYWLNEKLTQ